MDDLSTPSGREPDAAERLVRSVLQAVPLVDGHNDLPWQYRERVDNRVSALDFGDTSRLLPPMHTDLRRLRAGGVGAQFWSTYIACQLAGPGAAREALRQIDLVHNLIASRPDDLELALTAADVTRIHGQGRIASLIGVEGGHAIENSLAVLRQLHRLGARYLTLTHSKNNDWADSATDVPEHGGLTEFGREVVREMNRLGMLVDLSHVSAAVMSQALDLAVAPVIFSHSSVRALTDHPRNVADDVLARLPGNGGVIMITFVPPFVSEAARAWHAAEDGEGARLDALYPHDPDRVERELAGWRVAHPRPETSIAMVADHIDHARRVAGVDHIGIGGDFDGVETVPRGLEDVSGYPRLLVELARRGWTADDLEKLAGRNVLRAMADAEAVAARLQRERPASEAAFEPPLHAHVPAAQPIRIEGVRP